MLKNCKVNCNEGYEKNRTRSSKLQGRKCLGTGLNGWDAGFAIIC